MRNSFRYSFSRETFHYSKMKLFQPKHQSFSQTFLSCKMKDSLEIKIFKHDSLRSCFNCLKLIEKSYLCIETLLAQMYGN